MLLSGMQHSTYAHAAYGNMVLNTWIKEIADVEPSHPRVDKEMVIPVPQPGEEEGTTGRWKTPATIVSRGLGTW